MLTIMYIILFVIQLWCYNAFSVRSKLEWFSNYLLLSLYVISTFYVAIHTHLTTYDVFQDCVNKHAEYLKLHPQMECKNNFVRIRSTQVAHSKIFRRKYLQHELLSGPDERVHLRDHLLNFPFDNLRQTVECINFYADKSTSIKSFYTYTLNNFRDEKVHGFNFESKQFPLRLFSYIDKYVKRIVENNIFQYETDSEISELFEIVYAILQAPTYYRYPMLTDVNYYYEFDLPLEVEDLINMYIGHKNVNAKCHLKFLNDVLYRPNKNHRFSKRSMPISNKFINKKSHKGVYKPRPLYMQMDFIKSLVPTAQVKIENNTLDSIKDIVDKITDKGLTHTIQIPGVENLFKQIEWCWKNEEVRDTLLFIAYLVLRFLVTAKHSNFRMLMDLIALYLTMHIQDEVRKSIMLVATSANIVQECLELYYGAAKPDYYERETFTRTYFSQMDLDTVGPLPTLIYSWMYYSAFKKEYKGDIVTLFLKECKEIKKAKEGMKDIVEFLFDVFKKCTSLLSGMTYSQVFSSNLYPQLDEYALQIQDYLNHFNMGLPFSKEDAVKIIQISMDLDKLIYKIPNSIEYSDYKRKTISLANSVTKFVSEIKKAGLFDDGTRIIPLAILIVGPSGVGKTTNMPQLLYELAALTMDDNMYESYKKSKDDFQYTYNPENEYFDRYRKQYFCVVDEFGALRDSPSAPNEGYLFMMRAINCWAYPVHMADLADKGMMFDSKIVIAIGNIQHLMVKSLICPEAVSRRFDFTLMLVPKLEFCLPGYTDDPWSRRLNSSLLTNEVTNTDHMEFIPYNIVTGEVVSSPLSWRETVNSMALKFKHKNDFSQSRLQSLPILQKHCDDLRSKYKPQMEVTSNCQISNRMKDITTKFNNSCEGISLPATIKDNGVYQALKEKVDDITNFIKNNIFVTAVVTSIPVVIMIWTMVRPVNHPQSAFAKPKNSVRVARLPTVKVARPVDGLSNQMCIANTEFDNVTSCVLRLNQYKLDCGNAKGYILFLKGRTAVMPHHFFDHLKSRSNAGEVVKFNLEKALNPGQLIEINFEDLVFAEYMGEDDVIFCYFKTMYMHRDITKFLPSRDVNLFSYNVHACLARLKNQDFVKMQTTEAIPIGAVKYEYYNNTCCYEYSIATVVGECGQVLFSADTRTSTKVMGIHIAGDNEKGVAFALFQQDFSAIDKHFESKLLVNVEVPVEKEFVKLDTMEKQMEGLDSKFCIVRIASKTVAIPTKTKIIKSPLHNSWHVSGFEPTLLYKKNGRDPWMESRSKYCPNFKSVDTGLMQACRIAYFSQCLTNSKKDWTYDGVLDFETAIKGIPGRMKGLNRRSSAGYLEDFDIPGRGKYALFGATGDYDFTSSSCKAFKEHLNNTLDSLKEGKKGSFIFTDYLKDERRKIGKSTRLFSASPVDYTVLCRQYYGSFTQWIIDNRIHNGICIGMNPFAEEWNTMARFLTSIGSNCIFGDFSAYDASLFVQVLYEAHEFIESWYFWQSKQSESYEQEKLVRKALFESLVNSHHVCVLPDHTIVYEFVGCVPSGHVLTTFINSLCNNILMRYCVCKIHYGFNDEVTYPNILPDFNFIHDNMRLVTFGDDNGLSVSSQLNLVNQQTLTEAMNSIGMTYTSEDKSENEYIYRTIDQCTFLKCHFRYDDELKRYVAAQALVSILDMPYWTKTDSKDVMSVPETVDILLGKLSLWGRNVYAEWSSKIIDNSIKKINYSPQRQTYEANIAFITSYEAEYL